MRHPSTRHPDSNPETVVRELFKGAAGGELLSALLDGECSAAELDRLMAELERDPQLQRRWSRMCRVREAMQDTRVDLASEDFCAGVMAAVQQDRIGGDRTEIASDRTDKVVSLPAGRSRDGNVSRWRSQPWFGVAAAASIAVLVLAGGHRWLVSPQPAAGSASAALNLAAAAPVSASGLQRVRLSVGSGQGALVRPVAATAGEPVEMRWSQLDADSARQLDEYMLEHGNLRAEQGMGASTLIYPRMAVHTAEYRTTDEPH
jgi:negative regulator of sigma E activity